MIDYGLLFMTGVLTSLHCIGMCGPIVLAYSVRTIQGASSKSGQAFFHAAYNLGRVLAYALLGALVGFLGMTISWFEQVGEVLAIVSGIIMILGGLAMFGVLPLPKSLSFSAGGGRIWRLHGLLIRDATLRSKFLLGLLTPLLPCGVLYSILAKAAAAGSTMGGALTMAVFAAGTAPALMLLGSASMFFSARVRKGAELVAAAAVVFMGVMLILRGLHVPMFGFIPTGSSEHHSCCDE
jgi:uncharacterized protein